MLTLLAPLCNLVNLANLVACRVAVRASLALFPSFVELFLASFLALLVSSLSVRGFDDEKGRFKQSI